MASSPIKTPDKITWMTIIIIVIIIIIIWIADGQLLRG